MNGKSNTAVVVVVAVLLIGVLVILPLFGMWTWGNMMGGGMMGGWYPYGMGRGLVVGMLIPLLFVVLIIVGAYLWLTSRREPAEDAKSITILNERYAKGELTKEQYLEMKEHLTKK